LNELVEDVLADHAQMAKRRAAAELAAAQDEFDDNERKNPIEL